MANRFPLVLDTTDNNKIKEIQTGDNLNLTGNSITGVQNITAIGTIDAADIRVSGNRIVAQTFADLTDTPSTFIGSPNYFVKVKSDGTGLEYRPLSDLGNIEIDTITVDTSIVPSTDNVGNVGTGAKKFNEIVATTLKGNLVSYNGTLVFNADTAKISYAALEGVPTFLSEFTDDVGYLQTADLDSTLAGLFDDGIPFETDVVGSVFGDDSTVLVDGVNSIITGDVLNSQITTTDLITTTATITTTTATTINGPSTGDLAIDAGTSGIINIGAGASTTAVNIENAVIETFAQGTGLGIAEITANTDLQITAGNRVKITGGVPFRFSSTTTANQLAIAAQEGDVIYNTTTSRLQMYQGFGWEDVNGNVDASEGTSNFNNVNIAGNLTVTGTTTNIETTNTNITDNVITLNKGEAGAGVTLTTSGIEIERGTEANRSLVWTENFGGKWLVTDDATLLANRLEANYLVGSLSVSTDDLVMTDGNVTATGTLTMGGNGLVQIVSVTTDIELLPVGKVKIDGNLEVTGTFDGDVTGSVFGDDSTIIVDGINGTLNGNLTGNVTGDVTGDITTNSIVSTSGNIVIEADNYVIIDSANNGQISIGQASGVGNILLGNADNGTDVNINGNVNMDSGTTLTLTGVSVTDAAFNLTGNIDGSDLTVGATATTIEIGNSGSTTTISGTVSMPAVVSGNITADDSMSITTATGDGNAISIGPLGTNRAVNLTADVIRISGDVILPIVATAGVVGDLKGSVVGDDSTVLVDGVNNTIPSAVVSGTEATNWNTAYGWGDHSTQNYIVDGTTDAITANMVAEDVITSRELADGNNYNGTFDGDITGSVFSEDSSMMIDGISGTIVGPISKIVGDVQQISGPGAISLDTLITEITTTGTDDAYSLADGILGQIKIIAMVGDGGDAILTPTTFATGTTITFSNANDNITLLFTSNGWLNTANQNATIA